MTPVLKKPVRDEFDDLFEVEDSSPESNDVSAVESSPRVAVDDSLANQLELEAIELVESPAATPLSKELSDALTGPERGMSNDDRDIDLLSPVKPEPATTASGKGTDPFAEDPTASIRLEGMGDDLGSPDSIHIRCPVCDSVMVTSKRQIGKKIKCSDCYSEIEVRPTDIRQDASKSLEPAKSASSPEEPLSAFPEFETDEAAPSRLAMTSIFWSQSPKTCCDLVR